MNHASLFTGIGGFDLAAQTLGWNNVFQCEIDEFCQRVLRYHFPKTLKFKNIYELDGTKYADRIDIISGGFPCQPFSQAGKRKGEQDNRYLWPEMLRVIKEIKPKWVVAENVYGILTLEQGMVFEQVCADLETEGYEVQAFIIPAVAKNAPHRRDRVWFVAHSDGSKQENNKGKNRGKAGEIRGDEKSDVFRELSSDGITTHSDNTGTVNTLRDNTNGKEKNKGREKQPQPKLGQDSGNVTNSDKEGLGGFKVGGSFKKGEQNEGKQFTRCFCSTWEKFPTEPPICSRNDGFPERLDGITFPKWRSESIKALGNAIVPQIALEIFKIINKLETK